MGGGLNVFFLFYREFKKIVFLIFLWLFLNIILNNQGFSVKSYFINPFVVIILSLILMFVMKHTYSIIIKHEKHIKNITIKF